MRDLTQAELDSIVGGLKVEVGVRCCLTKGPTGKGEDCYNITISVEKEAAANRSIPNPCKGGFSPIFTFEF